MKSAFGTKALGGSEPGQFVEQTIAGNVGSVKGAGRKLDPGDADSGPRVRRKGGKVIGLTWVEQIVLGESAGSDDARNLSTDQSLGQSWILDLVADGDAVSGAEEVAQVGVEGLDGKPGHRDRAVAAGERQPEDAGGEFGVLKKQLVEVAHAEQQEHPRVAILSLPVLLHHRRHVSGEW